MPDNDKRDFSSQFRKGWEESWLSFGKWLGGCAPIFAAILFIIGIMFVLMFLFSFIVASSANR